MQTAWAQELDPILTNPILKGRQISNQVIKTGLNVINHKLQRKLQGWFITGINGFALIYDTQASNQTPQLTLNLTSDADVTVSLWVY
jgi:hypothetical protein